MFKKTISLQLIISLLAITLAACATPAQSSGALANPPAPPAESQMAESSSTMAASTGPSQEPSAVVKGAPTSDQGIRSQAKQEHPSTASASYPYTIVDTGQDYCYSDTSSVSCPSAGEAFYGQDAQYQGNQPAYVVNGDGTITDRVTGLMWTQSSDLNGDGVSDVKDKLTYDQAVAGAESFKLAGYDDWRLPTIKELYSLILFSGADPSGWNGVDTSGLVPFIDDVFTFGYGDTSAGERIIDAQFATTTQYVSGTMGGKETMFGVNFADGRIKGYPIGPMMGQSSGKLFFVLYVRGNPGYGVNDFVDNQDGTVTDNATGLTWMQGDSGKALNWEDALNYCESLDYAGQEDWRLPNVKELQSIVDYSRSPDTTNSAAIDPLFDVTAITNEAGQADYAFYWSSTTHANMQNGGSAAYVSFGRAWGYMNGRWMDVHGAGAQRSDPKSGDPADYPAGRGPQGDAIRIYNYARCVRGGVSDPIVTGGQVDPSVGTGATPPGNGAGQGEQPRQGPADGSGQGVPPQEAIDACTGLSEGVACSFTTPYGTVNGSCLMVQDQLACVPEGGPGGQGPPPRGGQP